MNKRGFALLLTIMLTSSLAIALAQEQPQITEADITQFRGSPLRTGVYDSPALTVEPTVLWQFPMPRPVRMTPAVRDSVVYIGGEDGRLYAINANTGEQLWRFDAGNSVVSSPVVTDDTLYVGSLDNSLYALDAVTGQLRWQFETDGQIYSSPALLDETLYFGSRDRHLYALSLEGDLVWQAETDGELWSSPAVSSGLVVIGGTDGTLSAFDQITGNLVWAVDIGSTRATPAIREELVFVGGADRLSAIDLTNGKVVATTQIGSGGLEASAAVTSEGIFTIALDGTLVRLDYDAANNSYTTVWSVNIGGPAYSSPSYGDGVIYVVTETGGLLYAFNAETGEQLWRFVTGTQGDWRASSPVLIDGILYIASNTQGMLALHNP